MKRPPNCMNPKSDFIFKKLFGEQETKESLIALLNAILKLPSDKQIQDLEMIENKELTRELITDKTGRLDIRALLLDRTQINIEMQLTHDKHMDRRTLFYLGKLFLESVKSGEGYHHLKKTITINLLDFNFLDIERYHSTFHIYEDHEPNYMLTDVLEIHMIEFPKFRKWKKDLSDPLHRWLLFLEAKLPADQLEELMEMDPVIKKAEERLARLNADDYTRELYEARENSRIEFNSKMHSSWEEGFESGMDRGVEQGIEQGIEQERKRGNRALEQERRAREQERREHEQERREHEQERREMARKLQQLGIAVEQISMVTGLTEDEIAVLASAEQ